MDDARNILRAQLLATALFAILKLSRSSWLALNPSGHLETFLWSFPNLFEGVIGALTLAGLLLIARQRELPVASRLSDMTIYAMACVGAAIYSVSQELGYHRFIGGANVTDMNDVYYSLAGVIVGAGVIYALKSERVTIG